MEGRFCFSRALRIRLFPQQGTHPALGNHRLFVNDRILFNFQVAGCLCMFGSSAVRARKTGFVGR